MLTYTATATTTMRTKAGMPSTSTASHERQLAPASLRAPTSHNTLTTPNTASTKTEFHLQASAAPNITPAASRHGRSHTTGPNSPCRSCRPRCSNSPAKRSRYQSRSVTQQATAATRKTA